MAEENFVAISVTTLVPSKNSGFDLYQVDQRTGLVTLYRGKDYPVTRNDIQRLRERGITCLHIALTSLEKYQEHLRKILSAPLDDQHYPVAARLGAMNEIVCETLKTSLGNKDVEKTINAVNQMSEIVSKVVSMEKFQFSDLLRVLGHDFTTFTHSANVAFYNAVLAKKLGYSSSDIELITTGGLLHDIGKLEISEAILCKPGKLDDLEFREIKKHPLIGFRKIATRPELSYGQLMMVYQHHERLDGKGYPVGCVSEEIHPWAKQCSVVDVYEALTSLRPYRRPMSPDRAMEILTRESVVSLDAEIVKCWNSIIQGGLNR